MHRKEKTELSGVKEIARRAKVSIATVDRVIHNRTGVAEKTRNRINKIIAELNYQPNIFARRLASRKNTEFAVLIPGVSVETSYWQAPLEGIVQAEKEVRPLGITVTKYFFDQDDPSTFIKQSRLVLKSKVAGVLLAPLFIAESIAFIAACREAGIPYVFIDADIPDQDKLSYIGPDLFQSGYLAGHLIRYGISGQAKLLVMNISEDISLANMEPAGNHRLFRKEEGIRAYFKNNQLQQEIIKADLEKADQSSIRKSLVKILSANPGIQAICVTNSRVSTVARCLETMPGKHYFLVGFDFTDLNIEYLEKGVIDFIICDKPQEQGYRGIMTLYQGLVLGLVVEKVHYMPIDIITKENYSFYRN
ncbi:LacI family DNA-binding transcriptional regulator [Flavihumibacter profundi]|uniref:LacI family DNA-binding transcriptional regulator n=1 Tax=Flavihumibacter profundi TaxID=2716883 RepID=UPI001CC7275B|nr:substrate-binding domain-containing protein [Flavihumibacter profundi]MBZ5858266.1 substrate-binding domain-containing protein [Flavihumibacter profundi]